MPKVIFIFISCYILLDFIVILLYNMDNVFGRLAQLVEHSLDVRRVSGSSPLMSTKKEVTFVYQKLLLFLSIAKAMAYHHALACISSPKVHIINRRLYRFRNDDIPQQVADDMQFLQN